MRLASRFVRTIAALVLCAAIIGCNTGSGDSDDELITLNVTDIAFDSVSYALSAKVNADNGTEITVSCNGKSVTTLCWNGRIDTVFDTPFYSGIRGGKSYDVTFSAGDKYKGRVTKQISYWPIVKCSVTTPKEVVVWCGSTKGYEAPSFTLNYEAGTYDYEMSFSISDASKDELPGETALTSNWKLADMLNYLSDTAHDGYRVTVSFKVVPDCPNGEELSGGGHVTYICKNDILAKAVWIVPYSGIYAAALSDEVDISTDSEFETAGGNVAYQWQISDDGGENWNNIPNAIKKIYNIIKSDIGKLIRVKITQTYQGEVKPTLTSEELYVINRMKSYELYYDDILTVGETFDTSKIKGTITDMLDDVHDVTGFNWVKNNTSEGAYTADYSRYFGLAFTDKSNGMYVELVDVYATVRAAITQSELPALSENVGAITIGKVKFISIDRTLEISFNEGVTFDIFPDGEFTANAGDTLYLRKPASGTPKTVGYIKESLPLSITVGAKNLGKKISGGGIISELKLPTLTLKRTKINGYVTITPVFDFDTSNCKTEYTYLIDGVPISNIEGAEVNSNNALVIEAEYFADDVYQISCSIRFYTDAAETDQETLGIISSSISLY